MNEDQIKQLGEAITKGVSETVEKNVLESVDQKFADLETKLNSTSRTGSLLNQEDLKAMEVKELSLQFIKAVWNEDKEAIKSINSARTGTKALSEGSDTAGGFLVPTEIANEIVRIANDWGLMRALARKFPMGSDTMRVPRLTTSVSVTWPGEAVAGTASDPVFGAAQLIAKTAVGLTVLSEELLADASVDVVDFLFELFGEALAGEEDNQMFNGIGAPFTGILNDSSVAVETMASGKDTFAEVDADELRDMISQIPALALTGSAFFMSPSVWGAVQQLKQNSQYIASLAVPILNNDATFKGRLRPAGTIWGYPVYLTTKLPAVSATAVSTKFLVFGNLQYFFYGDRQSLEMSLAKEAVIGGVSMFETNQRGMRVTERVAMTVGVGAGLCVLKTAAS